MSPLGKGAAPLFAAVVLWASGSFAAWPPAVSNAEALKDPANWPSDPLFAQSWWMFGFAPDAMGQQLSSREVAAGVGSAFDASFVTSGVGSPEVVVALLSSGVRWDEPDLSDAFALNEGEVPVQDVNGDGVVSVRDFTSAAPGQALTVDLVTDSRLLQRADKGDTNGNGVLDAQDLVRVFSNGVDDDGNGFVDDLVGWDFVDGDNDAFDPSAAAPGLRAALRIAARADNGIGGLGTCPACRVLPLRVAEAQVAAPARLKAALKYVAGTSPAVDSVAVAACASARSASLGAAIDSVGALVVSPACADVGVPMPNRPGGLIAGAVGPETANWQSAKTFLQPRACSGNGHSVDLAVAGDSCALDAVPLLAGYAARIHGALTPPHVAALLRGHTFAVDAERALAPGTGRGRVEAFSSAGDEPLVAFSAPLDNARVPDAANVAVEGTVTPLRSFVLQAAHGLWPKDADFVDVPFTMTGADRFTATVERSKLPASNDPALTLRIVAEGQVRDVVVFSHSSNLWARGFPLQLAEGVAAPARLLDLDGDGTDEVVAASQDGRIHALTKDATELAGFPLNAPGAETGDATVVAQPAFADLNGDKVRDVIVSTLEGRLAALKLNGTALFETTIEGGMRASPVVAPSPFGPQVVAISETGLFYAFFSDGSPVEGTPLALPLANVTHAPAVADLDGDGLQDAVVVGNAPDGRAVAVVVSLPRAKPAIRNGWPVELGASGTPQQPVIADFDGDLSIELATGVEGGPPVVLDANGNLRLRGAWPDPSPGAVPVGPAVVDFDGRGKKYLLGAQEDALAAWKVGTQLLNNAGATTTPAPQRAGYPVAVGLPQGAGISAADIDGSGAPDVLVSGKSELWAVHRTGEPLASWPQYTAAPLLGAPSIGVRIDRQVVAGATSDGWLYLWNVNGMPDGIQWDGDGHDPEHTGNFAAKLPERIIESIGLEEPPELAKGCCTGAPSPVDAAGLGVLLLALRIARPRRRA